MMAVGYAVSIGKINMRYVEKVALNWLENGITTIEAANENLLLLQQTDDAAKRVQKLTGKARELDWRQRQMAHTWIYIWGQSESLIGVALQRAADKGKPLIPYANAILERWREDGISEPEQAKKTFERETPAAKRRAQNEKTSLDLQGYEQILEEYIPVLPTKKGKE
jgi:DnaD/phage-associated family protein